MQVLDSTRCMTTTIQVEKTETHDFSRYELFCAVRWLHFLTPDMHKLIMDYERDWFPFEIHPGWEGGAMPFKFPGSYQYKGLTCKCDRYITELEMICRHWHRSSPNDQTAYASFAKFISDDESLITEHMQLAGDFTKVMDGSTRPCELWMRELKDAKAASAWPDGVYLGDDININIPLHAFEFKHERIGVKSEIGGWHVTLKPPPQTKEWPKHQVTNDHKALYVTQFPPWGAGEAMLRIAEMGCPFDMASGSSSNKELRLVLRWPTRGSHHVFNYAYRRLGIRVPVPCPSIDQIRDWFKTMLCAFMKLLDDCGWHIHVLSRQL